MTVDQARPLPTERSGKSKIRQTNVERVLRAVAKTGAHVSVHIMRDGSIELMPVSDDDTLNNEFKPDIVL
jgi:hypothetical protein